MKSPWRPPLTPQPLGKAVPSPASPNIVAQAGFYVMLVYLFLSFSRLLDFAASGLRLPIVLFGLMCLAMVISGSVLRIFRSRVLLSVWALFLWVMITIPFSTWKGGSMEAVVETFRAVVLATAITTLTTNLKQSTIMVGVFAASTTMGALLGLFFGIEQEGRLVFAQGTFRDPNIYATALLLGIPLWLYFVPRLPLLMKLLPTSCILINLAAFLRAGSRGASLGLLAMVCILFLKVNAAKRVIVLVVSVVVLTSGYFLLPPYLQKRYFTFFSAVDAESEEEAARLAGADVGSTYARWVLLQDAFGMALRHPLVGVGPGQFAIQNWEYGKLHGKPVGNVEAHNTYGQIASETGLPGLFLYVLMIVLSVRSVSQIMRLGPRTAWGVPSEAVTMSRLLSVLIITYAVCASFLSLAYGTLTYVVPAIGAAFAQAVTAHLSLSRAAAAAGGVQTVLPSGQVSRGHLARR